MLAIIRIFDRGWEWRIFVREFGCCWSMSTVRRQVQMWLCHATFAGHRMIVTNEFPWLRMFGRYEAGKLAAELKFSADEFSHTAIHSMVWSFVSGWPAEPVMMLGLVRSYRTAPGPQSLTSSALDLEAEIISRALIIWKSYLPSGSVVEWTQGK